MTGNSGFNGWSGPGNRGAHVVYAGPVSGYGLPAFRALVIADLPATLVQTTRQVLTGTGLRGGGDLSADRTVDYDLENIVAGRLTLTTGVPVTTSDVTAATTIYFTPYKGSSIALYSGSAWQLRKFSEISIASLSSNPFQVFDIFGYDNAGTVALETTNWNYTTGTITGATAASPCVVTSTAHGLSNGDMVGISGIVGSLGTDATNGLNTKIYSVAAVAANTFQLEGSNTAGLTYTSGGTWAKVNSTRATALVLQDGVHCKSGVLTRRYLGTAMTLGNASGQTSDSSSARLLWNNYNRAVKPLKVIEATDTWTYTTATWRAANGSTANRVAFIRGLDEDSVEAQVHGTAGNASVINMAVGIGLRTTSVNSAITFGSVTSGTTGGWAPLTAEYRGFPGSGYSFLQWLEISTALGTTTWIGDNGTAVNQCGLTGSGLF
jgi:hypothetical protein